MSRRKRTRRRNELPIPNRTNISILFFAISVLIFVSQTLLPSSSSIKKTTLRHETSKPKLNRQYVDQVSTAKPKNWFQATLSNTANAPDRLSDSDTYKPKTSLSTLEVSPPLVISVLEIPKGPFPLPSLSKWTDANSTTHGTVNKVHAGSSWAASLANGILSALPAHWIVERLHSAPVRSEMEEREFTNDDSIFTARRKGSWIGCGSAHHLVCKGAYRAMKVVDAVKVADVACIDHVGWLPHVLGKLRSEYRLIRLICIVPEEMVRKEVMELYKNTAAEVSTIFANVLEEEITEKVDLLLGYGYLRGGTLIRAMRFLKLIKQSGNVNYLLLENYPDETNAVVSDTNENTIKKDKSLRINTGIAPFFFPKAVYEYKNEEENDERFEKTIKMVKVRELFESRMTIGYDQLIDPRKKKLEMHGM